MRTQGETQSNSIGQTTALESRTMSRNNMYATGTWALLWQPMLRHRYICITNKSACCHNWTAIDDDYTQHWRRNNNGCWYYNVLLQVMLTKILQHAACHGGRTHTPHHHAAGTHGIGQRRSGCVVDGHTRWQWLHKALEIKASIPCRQHHSACRG